MGTMMINDDDDELRCLDESRDICVGAVELRAPLSATGRSFARCERHWNERLRDDERLRREYPDSPFPPAWFDPANAGETWDGE
jgi:hypothetical protein